VQAGKPIAIPYVSTSGALLVAFAVPVMRDGVMKAVVVGDVSLDSVVANIKSIHPTPSGFGMLIDNNGRVIAHPDLKLAFKPVADIAPEFDRVIDAPFAATNTPVQLTVNDKRKLIRAQSVRGTDWNVVIALDKSEATAGMRSLLTASLVSLTVIVVIASLIDARLGYRGAPSEAGDGSTTTDTVRASQSFSRTSRTRTCLKRSWPTLRNSRLGNGLRLRR
jgi:methyl-accepting chemotaxis protein